MAYTQKELDTKLKEYKMKLAEVTLDLPVMIERLQLIGFHDVNFNDPADIKIAIAEWFSGLISEIEECPEEFIRRHCTNHFTKMLPEPCDQDCYQPLSDDDEFELMLPIVPSNPVVAVNQCHSIQGIDSVEIHSVTASVTASIVYSVVKVNQMI